MVRFVAGLVLAPIIGTLGAIIAAIALAVHNPGHIGIGLLWEALFGSAIALATTCFALPLADLYLGRTATNPLLLPAVGLVSGVLTTVILTVPAFIIAGALAGAVAGLLFHPVRRIVAARSG